MNVIDTYLEKIEQNKRKELDRIRSLVKTFIPETEEVISYAIPTLKYNGKYLI